MFQLDEPTTMVLTSVNTRAEMHGDEKVPALDLGFRWETSNAVLGRFDPWLLTALYHRSAAADAQGDIPGVEKVMQNLRMAKLGAPLHWQEELIGYFLEIEYGTGGKSNLRLDAVDVNKFKLTPKEGGTTIVEFRVQASTGITERIFGKLPLLLGHEVKITLLAPKVDGAQQQEEQPSLTLAGNPQPDRPLTPEDVFTAGVAPGALQASA
jgi:hypothetical protein